MVTIFYFKLYPPSIRNPDVKRMLRLCFDRYHGTLKYMDYWRSTELLESPPLCKNDLQDIRPHHFIFIPPLSFSLQHNSLSANTSAILQRTLFDLI